MTDHPSHTIICGCTTKLPDDGKIASIENYSVATGAERVFFESQIGTCGGVFVQQFYDLMEAYARADTDDIRQQIQDEVWEQYGVEQTVHILDMSGFSRLTQKRGIVHYLSMVRHMQLVAQPIIERFGGSVVKFEADNAFCRFPTVENAIDASISLNIALDAMNMMTQDDLNIYISCGIDYGRFLLVEDSDFFGSAVNIASKLSEDIGSGGDILVTSSAMALLPAGVTFKSEAKSYEISGVEIDAQRIIF